VPCEGRVHAHVFVSGIILTEAGDQVDDTDIHCAHLQQPEVSQQLPACVQVRGAHGLHAPQLEGVEPRPCWREREARGGGRQAVDVVCLGLEQQGVQLAPRQPRLRRTQPGKMTAVQEAYICLSAATTAGTKVPREEQPTCCTVEGSKHYPRQADGQKGARDVPVQVAHMSVKVKEPAVMDFNKCAQCLSNWRGWRCKQKHTPQSSVPVS
jgi:hypothetical protein